MTTEYYNRMYLAFKIGSDTGHDQQSQKEAMEIASILARDGFSAGEFRKAEEVRIAAQAIIINLDNNGEAVGCTACGAHRVCAVNAFIDRMIADGVLGHSLGRSSRFALNYNLIEGCGKRDGFAPALVEHYAPESGAAW